MKLTDTERATLNEAMAILQGRIVEGGSFNLNVRWTRDCEPAFDVSYFDSSVIRGQHTWVAGDTLADKVQTVLDIEANLPTPEETRAARLKRLRDELAKLENAA